MQRNPSGFIKTLPNTSQPIENFWKDITMGELWSQAKLYFIPDTSKDCLCVLPDKFTKSHFCGLKEEVMFNLSDCGIR